MSVGKQAPVTVRVAGCDLGTSNVRLVVTQLTPNGSWVVESVEERAHEGHPLDAFARWYRDRRIDQCQALGATGRYAAQLQAPALAGLPEDACVELALEQQEQLVGPLSIVRIGARGYSVLTRSADGGIRYTENEKCSSGTGETMVKLAARFGLSVEAADALAQSSAESVPITARCSVFAKSEMTHFANSGSPAAALFKGYFESVARHVAALVARVQVPGPVVVLGGASRIETLVSALGLAVPGELLRPDGGALWEALGAARAAAQQLATGSATTLPVDPSELIRDRQNRVQTLAAVQAQQRRVTRLEPIPVPAGALSEPTVLGLDLGSTGSKAVLTSLATGERVADCYERTQGNPVEATQALLRTLLARGPLDVRAIGVTGSGREAAASVLRAALVEAVQRVVVVNEIVAHATAAIRCDPSGGESLSVVEIGGQDAKFIQIAGGQIVESDMNKACSAGTGSFLEEQAALHGVADISAFTELASGASRPPDLGQMCTVFIADAAQEALAEGFEVPDIFAGFQYSVVHNYLHRVMGQRTLARTVFLQGKPATNPSLAWTLAAVSGREVVVPSNPGAMGAWGIGLCTIDELGRSSLEDAPSLPLAAALEAEVVGRGEIRCVDHACATLCVIDQTHVSVRGQRKTVLSGGACPKFEIAGVRSATLPRDAPSPFREREALLTALELDPPASGDGPVVGIPLVGGAHGVLPWLVAFVRGLGFQVRVLRSGRGSLSRGEELCASYDSCAPAKVAHAVCDSDVDVLFFPKLIELAERGDAGCKTCPVVVGLPEMVALGLAKRRPHTRVLRPELWLSSRMASPSLLATLVAVAKELGVGAKRALKAAASAAMAQRQYERDLREIGRRALGWGRRHRASLVVVCGSLHVIHDDATNARLPHLLRKEGVLAIPQDCLPLSAEAPRLPRVAWADMAQSLRVGLACRDQGDLYPLLLTSFGCGPSSFGEQIFSELMQGHPHTVLESDGHGGAAGYVTRVQAFLFATRRHNQRPSAAPAAALEVLEPLAHPPLHQERGSVLVTYAMGDRYADLSAAFYRSFGFDAVAAGPPSAAALAAARRDCSGKECLPYQMIWGTFRERLDAHPPDQRTVLMQVSGSGMCRNCMFSIKDQVTLRRAGLEDLVSIRHGGAPPEFAGRFVTKFFGTVVAWDILGQMRAWFRPDWVDAGPVEALYESLADELQELAERPERAGPAGLPRHALWLRELTAFVERSAESFAALAASGPPSADLPRVLVAGDVYLRADEFASDGLLRRLNARGLRVLVDPVCSIVEYLAAERSSELLGLPVDRATNAAARVLLAVVRRRLYGVAQRHHAWLPAPEPRATRAASIEAMGRNPVGEAPMTIGTVLHSWRQRQVDGVVVVGPWGCGPSLVTESLLRQRTDIPSLFVYRDGTPSDERKLDGFAFRLRRAAATGTTGPSAAL
jgi:activator of 2-hydroxyglutaryl-CoA dehydratase/predicted nucleotide-binding protein (sugar kinase/HSP70/actin superfamily)